MNLRRFPRRTLRGDGTIYRIHRTVKEPWWFSADGSGRFDPVGTGLGACYLAERAIGAWVEVFRKQMLIAEADVLARSLLEVRIGRDLRLADLTSRRALGFGVTASLGADEDYTASQAFAVAATEHRFDGIRHFVRHDPAQKLYGVALFGAAGVPPESDSSWPVTDDGLIQDELIDEAAKLFGYRVWPDP